MTDTTERLMVATGLSKKAAEYVALAIGFLRYCPEAEREQATKVVAAAGYQLAHPGSPNAIGIVAYEVESHR